jgi:hypothetical protein
MSPSAVAEDEPIEIKIEQLRQWGFCVLPRVIAQLPEVAAEVAAFQADAKEYYSTVTGMSDAMRAEMMRKLASSTASKLEARQLGNVSGGGTAASEEATDAEAADWRLQAHRRGGGLRARGGCGCCPKPGSVHPLLCREPSRATCPGGGPRSTGPARPCGAGGGARKVSPAWAPAAQQSSWLAVSTIYYLHASFSSPLRAVRWVCAAVPELMACPHADIVCTFRPQF